MKPHAHRYVFPPPSQGLQATGVCSICGAESTPHWVVIPEYSEWKALSGKTVMTERKRGAVFKAIQDSLPDNLPHLLREYRTHRV